MNLSYNPAMTGVTMLEARTLSKWYGAIRAVSDVGFTLAAGEVVALRHT
jgi:ABC-type sugar transport system ATPase subunit